MNRKDFVRKIAENSDLTIKQTDEYFDKVITAATEVLESGEPIKIVGFGTLEPIKRAARTGTNPQTGEKISIPECKTVKFKIADTLRAKWNS